MVFELGLWQVRDNTFSLGVNQGGNKDAIVRRKTGPHIEHEEAMNPTKNDMGSDCPPKNGPGFDHLCKTDMWIHHAAKMSDVAVPVGTIGTMVSPGGALAEFVGTIGTTGSPGGALAKFVRLEQEYVATGCVIAGLKKESAAELNEEDAVVIRTTAGLKKTKSADANRMEGAHVEIRTAPLRRQVLYGGTGTLCSRKNSKRKAKKKEQAERSRLTEALEEAAQSRIRCLAANRGGEEAGKAAPPRSSG